ncbi:MAG: hypothetical protein J5367_05470 [Lachnospiraceae bacterium]|nr:hypothetical protein [Lachnospiraceae bacterium]
MKKIRIAFTDFWGVFDPNDNFIMDALRKNFEVEISDKDPEFVFCSIFGRRHLKYDCAKIFYTGENIDPDFNLVDYALGFPEIDYYDRYLRLPHYLLYPRACKLALSKPSMSDEELLNRKFCNYVISNALSSPERGIMIDKLERYKPLASGGRYHNNVGGPVADKIDFSRGYKFSIAFENSGSRGYTTEKIMESFASQTIPIYWGNPDIAKEFNPDSFINCHDFANFDEVVDFVKKIDSDDTAYLNMVKAPMIRDDSLAAKCLDEDYLSDFLFKICSQDPTAAIRRNRVYIGKHYEDEAKLHEKLDRVLRLPRRAVRGMKNRIKRVE